MTEPIVLEEWKNEPVQTFESIDRIIRVVGPYEDPTVTCSECGRAVRKYKNWKRESVHDNAIQFDTTWRGKCDYGHRIVINQTAYGWNRSLSAEWLM